jgi:hypothetical protein
MQTTTIHDELHKDRCEYEKGFDESFAGWHARCIGPRDRVAIPGSGRGRPGAER